MVCSAFIAHLLLVGEKVFGQGDWLLARRKQARNGCEGQTPAEYPIAKVYAIKNIAKTG